MSLSEIRFIVGVAAGKGGVGKSTVATNLGLYLSSLGAKVGILDADIYGPSLQRMLSETKQVSQHTENKAKIIPAESRGIKLISMAYFLDEKDPASVRAPIANGIIKQFLHQVDWGNLDYLIIDFPPGTGDIQLTLIQEANLSGAILVTTPQQVALCDVGKALKMLREMQVPLIGVVENMSYYKEKDGGLCYPFGKKGGEEFAQQNDLYFLGSIPLDPEICRCSDTSESLLDNPSSLPAQSMIAMGSRVVDQLEAFEKLGESKFIPKIQQKDLHRFTIEWSDGIISEYRLSDLQRICICAQCRDEKTGKSRVDPASIPEDLEAFRIVNVGRYGLQILFSEGCSKGIYSFKLLRSLS